MTEPIAVPSATTPSPDVKKSTPWTRAKSLVERRPGTFLIVGAALTGVLMLALSLWVTNFHSAATWKEAAHEARAGRDAAQIDLALSKSKVDALRAASGDLEKKVSNLESEAAAVEQQAADLKDQAAAVAEREVAVSKTEDQIAANTISEGIWTVGVDIKPGTYRTKESPYDCYWAIYTSGTNQGDIIQNDLVDGGRPTVTLKEGQDFETSGCGEWIK